jgi:hypothetical protein
MFNGGSAESSESVKSMERVASSSACAAHTHSSEDTPNTNNHELFPNQTEKSASVDPEKRGMMHPHPNSSSKVPPLSPNSVTSSRARPKDFSANQNPASPHEQEKSSDTGAQHHQQQPSNDDFNPHVSCSIPAGPTNTHTSASASSIFHTSSNSPRPPPSSLNHPDSLVMEMALHTNNDATSIIAHKKEPPTTSLSLPPKSQSREAIQNDSGTLMAAEPATAAAARWSNNSRIDTTTNPSSKTNGHLHMVSSLLTAANDMPWTLPNNRLPTPTTRNGNSYHQEKDEPPLLLVKQQNGQPPLNGNNNHSSSSAENESENELIPASKKRRTRTLPFRLRNKKMKPTDCLLFAATLLEENDKKPGPKSPSKQKHSRAAAAAMPVAVVAVAKQAATDNNASQPPPPLSPPAPSHNNNIAPADSRSTTFASSAVAFENNNNIKMDSDDQPTEPRDVDVLCGRGGLINKHPGNIVYRKVVDYNKPFYQTVHKKHRILVSQSIVQSILNDGGRFLMSGEQKIQAETSWTEIGYKRAVQKTSQALRERVSESTPGEEEREADEEDDHDHDHDHHDHGYSMMEDGDRDEHGGDGAYLLG